MSKDAMRALGSELGARPPRGLAGLDPEQLEDLAAAVREAKRRQAAELAAAGEHSLRFIPRLLRGPVRKVFG